MVRRRVRAYIALGANVGKPEATLGAAVHALAALPGVHLAGVSRLYATDPVGVTDQPEFRNAVVALDVPAGPDPASGALALLIALKGLEAAFGRQARRRWGPRELDLDLIVFGRARLAVDRPPAGRSTDRVDASAGGPPARGSPSRWPPSACSCSRRWPTWRPAWSRRAGRESVATARRRREIAEGPEAVRPIGAWDPVGGAVRPLEPDAGRPRPVEHLDRVDEPDLGLAEGHHERMGPGAAAEEPDAIEQVASGDPGRGEDEVVCRTRGRP